MSLWLAKDQRSNEVVALQNALNLRLKPVKPLVLDGIFGPLTEGAVRDFQKCQNLKADGIAGPQTLGCLFVRRTVVNKFVLTIAPPAIEPPPPRPRRDDPRNGPRIPPYKGPPNEPTVGSPYDPPKLPTYPRAPSFEEQLEAWLRDPPPKRICPVMPPPRSSDANGAATGAPLSPQAAVQKHVLGQSQPSAQGWMSRNEWLDFEYAADIGKESGHELEIVQSFSAAFVKLHPYIMPSTSFVLAPGGGSGIQASIQYFDHEIFEREWKNMVGDPTTAGTLRIAPYLITSTMWEFGKKYPSLDIFGGLRIEANWKKEWHGRRGRAHLITLFAGLAFGTVIVGEKEAEGRFRMNWFGAEGKFQIGLKYGIGRRRRH
jgi:hypothetical protein